MSPRTSMLHDSASQLATGKVIAVADGVARETSALPAVRACRPGEIVEGRLIAVAPAADRDVQSYVVAASLCPVLPTMLRARVTHPAGADVGACVVQHPVAFCRGEPSGPGHRRMIGQIARSMGSCMRGFRSEFAAGESNPQRTVGICAGQGGASRGSRPCPLPPDEDGQGLRCLHRVPSPATPFSHVRNLTPPTDSQLLSHDTTHR